MLNNNENGLKPPKMKIISLDAAMRNEQTILDETISQNCLVYETPLFRAVAKLSFPPIYDESRWKIGFIQGCVSMKFNMKYSGAGTSSWEFPAMSKKEKTAVNDSDSRNYPFYDSRHSSYEIFGPTKKETKFSISLHDHFNPWVPWKSIKSGGRTGFLKSLERDQSFLVWLVAINLNNRELFVFKTIRWQMYLKIVVDPKSKVGNRAKLVSNPEPPRPFIYPFNLPVPHEVMYPPTANSAQVLAWKGINGASILLVPPKYYDPNDMRPYIMEKGNRKTSETESD